MNAFIVKGALVEKYNDEVIWPDKVAINKKYIEEWSLKKDIGYIWKTVVG